MQLLQLPHLKILVLFLVRNWIRSLGGSMGDEQGGRGGGRRARMTVERLQGEYRSVTRIYGERSRGISICKQ